MAKKKLNVQPFPPLQWDDYGWAGKITLPSWAGFQARGGAYGSRSAKKPSDGTARLHVAVEDDEAQTLPTQAQTQAMQHLLHNEAAVAGVVLQAIFEIYPDEKAAYEDAYDEEEGETLPTINKPSGLRTLMGLSNVHLLYVQKDGTAYIGFEFGCVWEEEHGVGVMTHLGRIVEVGQADCSFLEWIAERDARRRKKKT
jgi:hypothetical protein